MPFVAAPNVVQLALICTQDNEPIENTFHYRMPAPASLADLTAMANTADTYWAAHNAFWPSNLSVIKYYLRALDSSTAPSFEKNPATAIDGTRTGNVWPNDVTLACTRYTGLAGRKNRGRVYWMGICDTDTSGPNTIAPSFVTNILGILAGFQTAMAGGTPSAIEVILHRTDGTHNDVIGWRVSDFFLDNQRRRLPGHNRHR